MEKILFFLIGALISWIFVSWRNKNTIKDKDNEILNLKGYSLEAKSKLEILNKSKDELLNSFKVLSYEALKSNNEQFLKLANNYLGQYHEKAKTDLEKYQEKIKTDLELYQEKSKSDLDKRHLAINNLVEPLKKSLNSLNDKTEDIENSRIEAYSILTTQIQALYEQENKLEEATNKLSSSLKISGVRGKWGEMQLRRTVEIAGMTKNCDFEEQFTIATEEGSLRPDMIIRLPADKNIIVDAKAPLNAYLESLEAKDQDIRIEKLKLHARHVRDHVLRLSNKKYWQQFENSPEFVILFLPGEMFYSAAIEQDKDLIEYAFNKKIMIVSPTILIAVLYGFAITWREEKVSQNAKEINNLGKELYDRVRTFINNFNDLGKSLDKSVETYNKSVGSLENRVLTTTKKFKELGLFSEDNISDVKTIEKRTKGRSNE